ncbi:hypothetical protein EV679_2429 [Kerstersia gyiorum]|uniref:Uncharacterized protein n=1 Tax=Kerstersia gyiorum TaxID=206506 RepID=A0A4Q7MIV0_9BURK|nr:hypothetical protein [Kerstersia gyiorum]MCP1636371.1 hypothetical protein [Kerstersia gyiorum]MCP1672789.1 hypothetical protein [Kerstersia gyiorum]MCP1680703.1 hypothetical protein [Kerstersia gyiorum]MCP1684005.1 hypothetical protein [Kerstersia gyiorum]
MQPFSSAGKMEFFCYSNKAAKMTKFHKLALKLE